jgi:3-oxoacyl-[acyl-carrier-protein] synthase-1
LKITAYEALCNLGNNIDEIYENAINGCADRFDYLNGYIKDKAVRAGIINNELKTIDEEEYNLRCNKFILKVLTLIKDKTESLVLKYGKNRIAVIAATTNSGVDEYETSGNSKQYEIGNPACFIHNHLKLEGYYASVSTACSSGLIAFSTAQDILNNDIADAVIIVCTDALSKVPVFGFHSLEVLSEKPTIPFSKNRSGMNIGEACAVFIVEKDADKGIDIMSIAQSSDIYHSTTPDPKGEEAIHAIRNALKNANLKAEDIDYINAHGTGTGANDLMEANAIYEIFKDTVPVSSTKPLTGHCLGAAAGIETALCCKLLEKFDGRLYPNIYDGEYDTNLPKINIVNINQKYPECKICMCNSFGFGGTNAIMILGKSNE